MQMKEVTLETERLLLRWFREDDFEDYVNISQDPEVMRFLRDGKSMTPMKVWRRMASYVTSEDSRPDETKSQTR